MKKKLNKFSICKKNLLISFLSFFVGVVFVLMFFLFNTDKREKPYLKYNKKGDIVYYLDNETDIEKSTAVFNFEKNSDLYSELSLSMIVNRNCNDGLFYNNCMIPYYIYNYAKDSKYVYYKEEKYSQIDTDSFLPISDYISIDKNGVYFMGNKIKGTSGFKSRVYFYADANDIYITDLEHRFVAYFYLNNNTYKTRISDAKKKVYDGKLSMITSKKNDIILFYSYF